MTLTERVQCTEEILLPARCSDLTNQMALRKKKLDDHRQTQLRGWCHFVSRGQCSETYLHVHRLTKQSSQEAPQG